MRSRKASRCSFIVRFGSGNEEVFEQREVSSRTIVEAADSLRSTGLLMMVVRRLSLSFFGGLLCSRTVINCTLPEEFEDNFDALLAVSFFDEDNDDMVVEGFDDKLPDVELRTPEDELFLDDGFETPKLDLEEVDETRLFDLESVVEAKQREKLEENKKIIRKKQTNLSRSFDCFLT